MFCSSSLSLAYSLSYKLGKVLRFQGADVLYSDEFATDPTFISKEQLVDRAEVVIVGRNLEKAEARLQKIAAAGGKAGEDALNAWIERGGDKTARLIRLAIDAGAAPLTLSKLSVAADLIADLSRA